MATSRSGFLSLVSLLLAGPAAAHPWAGWSPGSLVAVEVCLEGRPAPLYGAPDGSGRWYLEAREGGHYSIRLTNRTAERLGVALNVDGLNVISGDRATTGTRPGDPGRLYVLGPGDVTEVRGWRTSLREIQRFVFVDERASYAARTGQANARMGWIEMAVYRERYPGWPRVSPVPPWRRDGIPPEPAAPLDDSAAARDQAEGGREGAAQPTPPAAQSPSLRSARPAYPGTGWGPRADDPAELVSFDPQTHPAERVTLRYEYREALLALGIDPRAWHPRDRLWERERGREGFAKPPGR